MAADVKEVIHKHGQPIKILLQKTLSGYNWEVHVSGKDLAEVLPKLREANNQLKGEYGRKEVA